MYDSAVCSARKTVFIIGAGASKEAGLHIKSELKTRIAKALDIWFENLDQMVSGDRRIFEALRARVANESDPKSLLRSLQ